MEGEAAGQRGRQGAVLGSLGSEAAGPRLTRPVLLPQDLRRKAARLVAAKCTLAARVDSPREYGGEGEGSARMPVCGLSRSAAIRKTLPHGT